MKGIMVAATRQHVGKTTTSLAIMSGVRKRISQRVGFLKPVGQEHITTPDGSVVDKDVRLFKDYFNLDVSSYGVMSPVVLPAGYTRKFLDGLIKESDQTDAVLSSFAEISTTSDFVVVEGTGHCGVGSIVNLDNAMVASLLGLDMILVVNGGLGRAVDELALNIQLCHHRNVKVKGVVVNKVARSKVGMITRYMGLALDRYKIPLIGVVPDADFLDRPTMLDYEDLFNTQMIARSRRGQELWHFDKTTLVAMSLKSFLRRLDAEQHSKTLFVTHASREDIVLGFVAHSGLHHDIWGRPWHAGMILAGEPPRNKPLDSILAALKKQDNPVLLSGRDTFKTMEKLSKYTPKLNPRDANRTIAAIDHYEKYIDFDTLLA